MIGIIRFIVLFAIAVVAWALFREVLYAFGILQKRTEKGYGIPHSEESKRKTPIEYSDVHDATFHEIPDDSKNKEKE